MSAQWCGSDPPRSELGDELADLAAKIRDGSVGPVSVVSDNELST